MMDHFEILIRSILIRPDKPAVFLLGHFSPQTHQTHSSAGPDHWHNIIARFYDNPTHLRQSCPLPRLHAGSQVCPEVLCRPRPRQPVGARTHLGDTCRLLPEPDMYGLKRSHWVVIQNRPSAHCRVRSRRRRRPWSIRRHWPTPRGP